MLDVKEGDRLVLPIGVFAAPKKAVVALPHLRGAAKALGIEVE